MIRFLLGLVLFLGGAAQAQEPRIVPPILWTPASAVEGAHGDASRLIQGGLDLKYYRYLSLYNCTTARELETQLELASFVLNSLNFAKRSLVAPERLEGGRLLRVDLLLHGIDPQAWDRLAREGSGAAKFPEPYFHQELESAETVETRTVETIEKRWWPGGIEKSKYYPPGYYDYKVTKTVQERGRKQTIHAQASWIPRDKILQLVQWCGTEYPILRADWFIVYAMQPPAYLAFQGNPKKFADLQKLAGIDAAALDRAGVQLRGAALFSEVASRNRALERTPAATNYGRGYLWESFDFFTSIRKNDLLKNLLEKKRDAGEIIWSLPNGLQGYGLVNGQGNVIEFADPRIATDNRTLLHDKVVWSGWKCTFCHAQGIIPIADEVRLSSRDFLGFLVPDARQAERVADLYFGEEINRLVIQDQEHYGAAVQALTGKAAPAIALAFQDLHLRYSDAPISLEDLCIETGYPMTAVRPIVEEVGRTGLSHSFVRLLRGRKARRDQVEESFQELMRVLALLKETNR